MRTLISLILSLAIVNAMADTVVVVGRPMAAAGAASFTDDFNRANSTNIGANWTEIAGDLQIISNTLSTVGDTDAYEAGIYSATSCSTVSQYGKLTATAFNSAFYRVGLILRYTDSTSGFYVLEASQTDDEIYWKYFSSSAFGGAATIQTVSQAIADGDSFGWVLTGAGDSTVVSFWLNPTGAAPTNSTTWGGSAATQTLTNNPGASAVDTGSLVGVSFFTNTGDGVRCDDLSGGDVP